MDRQRVQAGIKGKSRYGVGYGRTADPETLFGYRQNRQSCRDPIYDEQQISGAGRGRSPGLILVDPAPALVPRYCRSVPFNEETSTGRVLLSNTCPPPPPILLFDPASLPPLNQTFLVSSSLLATSLFQFQGELSLDRSFRSFCRYYYAFFPLFGIHRANLLNPFE